MYISPHCRLAPVQQNFMKFGIRGQLTDVIMCVKFLVNRYRFRGSGVPTPQYCHFPLTCSVTLTTVYALPCDTVMREVTYSAASGVYPPRSSGVISPIRIPHAFLPTLPFVMSSTFSFPSPLLLSTPAISPLSFRPLLNLGMWIQPRKNLANLNVRSCILMCIVYIENSHWALCKNMDLCHYFSFGHYLKHLIQWIVMLFWILLMIRQLPSNFIALLQNWLDKLICYACVSWGGSLSY